VLLNSKPYTLHPQPYTLNPTPSPHLQTSLRAGAASEILLDGNLNLKP
jgi:hypothetical protein